MTSPTSRRLLVVEDEPLVANGLIMVLRRLGYTIAALVDNGEEAVKLTFSLVPDLVLMDISLKGQMDGAEAARQIRITTGRPVVFLSGHSDPLTLKKARECEPYGFILKPFGERELLVQIDLAIHRHQVETQRELARRELEIAHENLKNMRGLLPVCAGCKKIQEADGKWLGLEDYFKAHANVEFTHGFCPDCENRLYGTHSRPPFPYVLPIMNPAEQEQLPLTVEPTSSDEENKKPATGKPRVRKKEKGDQP
ncbi:MAG: response regulator [Nibricoccus sp.]